MVGVGLMQAYEQDVERLRRLAAEGKIKRVARVALGWLGVRL